MSASFLAFTVGRRAAPRLCITSTSASAAPLRCHHLHRPHPHKP